MTVSDWASFYMSEMMPASLKDGQVATLQEVYSDVTKLLFGDDFDARMNPNRVLFREDFLGPDVILQHSLLYNELSVVEQVGLDNWERLSVREKGQWTAFYMIKNMESFVRQYKEHQKSKKKKPRSES